MATEMVPETSVISEQLSRLAAPENCIESNPTLRQFKLTTPTKFKLHDYDSHVTKWLSTLLLLITGIWTILKWPGLQCHAVYIKFPEGLLSDSKVEIAEYTVRYCI